MVTNCDHLKKLKFSRNLPYAFTEHGAIMLAAILSSPIAVQASQVGWAAPTILIVPQFWWA